MQVFLCRNAQVYIASRNYEEVAAVTDHSRGATGRGQDTVFPQTDVANFSQDPEGGGTLWGRGHG